MGLAGRQAGRQQKDKNEMKFRLILLKRVSLELRETKNTKKSFSEFNKLCQMTGVVVGSSLLLVLDPYSLVGPSWFVCSLAHMINLSFFYADNKNLIITLRCPAHLC